MKLYAFIVITFMLLCVQASAQSPNFQWAKKSAGTGYERIMDSATDTSGNVYVCGWFDSIDMDFGNDVFAGNYAENAGTKDAFVAKYSSAGQIVWATRIGERGDEIATAITIDKESNLYICGKFSSPTLECGATTLVNSGKDDCFFAKMDSSGAFLWAKKAGGKQEDILLSIAIDRESNIVMCGNYFEKIDFNDTASLSTPTYQRSFFLAKCDSSGEFLWVKGPAECTSSGSIAVVVDDSGNIYLNGTFLPKVIKFGDGVTLTNIFPEFHGRNDIFLTKYDSGGKTLWAERIAANGEDVPTGLALDSANNILSCGYFVGQTLDLGAIILKNKYSDGRYRFFTAKYNEKGEILWAKSAEGQEYGEEIPFGIATDKKNNVYLCGHIFTSTGGPVNFGDNIVFMLPSPHTNATFIVKYNADGNTVSGRYGTGFTRTAIAVHNDSDIYISGLFQGKLDLGNGLILQSESQNADVFIAKLGTGITSAALPEYQFTPPLTISPNPSNSSFLVRYSINEANPVTITLTDVLGRQTLLKEETLDAGEHSADINTADFPAGIYVLTLEAGGQVISQKVVIER